MARVGCLRVLCLWRLLMMVWSARVVFEFGLNAYCVGDMMSCLTRCAIS